MNCCLVLTDTSQIKNTANNTDQNQNQNRPPTILLNKTKTNRLGRPPLDFFSSIPEIHRAGVAEARSTALNQHGLDDNTLDSYPKFLYSELQKGSSVSSCCSICLEDYKDTDSLRLLPDCDHVYHLSCVDPWLKQNPTCPLCRSSSFETPQSNTSMQEILVHVV
ncbi:hypothetical protein L6164_005594 [Bauhinia variegata]|uniref:Uncharacterized protein n=1 Tax=Bauhinia variegata TaxID=167791 RepID=A0ACB9PRT0_BAUVA|nr:hypothetical protein L6164_005594 [Bauhinia variegata]